MEEIKLQDQEIQAISNLKEDFGFKMLLDRLQAEVDNAQLDLLDCESPVNIEKVIFWRVLYKVNLIFKTLPEQMTEELKRIKEETKYKPSEDQMATVPTEYLQALLKQYQKLKKKV